MNKRTLLIKWLPVLAAIGIVLVFYLYNRGTVVITSNEPMAVTVDGRLRGESKNKYTLRLETGSHQLVMKRDGFYNYEEEVVLRRGDRVEITPEWIYEPILRRSERSKPYYLEETEIADNQLTIFGLLDEGEMAQRLAGIPTGVEEVIFNSNEKYALLRTADSYGVYELTTAETTWLDGRIRAATWLGDQLLYYYKRPEDITGYISLSDAKNIQFDNVVRLSGITDLELYPSPDRQKVALINRSAGNDQNVYLITLDDRRRRKVTESNNVTNILWTPDSERLLINLAYGDNHPVHSYDIEEMSLESTGLNLDMKSALLSADERLYFYVATEERPAFYVYNLGEQQATEIARPQSKIFEPRQMSWGEDGRTIHFESEGEVYELTVH